ncbi:MAG: hypothetical protein Q8L48_31855 [Archangium sp.]|nr:hypothetical protein [Archangium sp.]
MTPQGQINAPQPGWFARNWMWVVGVGCLVPLLCCSTLSVVMALLPSEQDAARVDCGTPGPAGVDCDLQRTSGTGSLEACWDLDLICANGAMMSAHHCGSIAAGQSAAKVNMPVSGFSNQDACDAPKSGVVMRLTVRTVE